MRSAALFQVLMDMLQVVTCIYVIAIYFELTDRRTKEK